MPTVPVVPSRPSRAIEYRVPSVAMNVTELPVEPIAQFAESSFDATAVSESTVVPVYTARTVLNPIVWLPQASTVTGPAAEAVHRNQTEWPSPTPA